MQNANWSSRGVLLIGHGSRDEAGAAEFNQAVSLVAARLPEIPVEAAYLELRAPDIGTGVKRIVDRGVDDLIVAPLLLFAAGHAKRDLPAAIQAAGERFPRLRICLAAPLACHDKLLELSERRFREAVPSDRLSRGGLRLVVVGRGSSDPEATAGMGEYAARLAARIGIERHEVAFVAMARPRLSDVLFPSEGMIPGDAAQTLVVQPHLLFQGEVLGEIQELATRYARSQPGIDLYVAGHLGPAELLAEALCDRIAEALSGERT